MEKMRMQIRWKWEAFPLKRNIFRSKTFYNFILRPRSLKLKTFSFREKRTRNLKKQKKLHHLVKTPRLQLLFMLSSWMSNLTKRNKSGFSSLSPHNLLNSHSSSTSLENICFALNRWKRDDERVVKVNCSLVLWLVVKNNSMKAIRGCFKKFR